MFSSQLEFDNLWFGRANSITVSYSRGKLKVKSTKTGENSFSVGK